jgi:hypothetical protein
LHSNLVCRIVGSQQVTMQRACVFVHVPGLLSIGMHVSGKCACVHLHVHVCACLVHQIQLQASPSMLCSASASVLRLLLYRQLLYLRWGPSTNTK